MTLTPAIEARIAEAAHWHRCPACYCAPCQKTRPGCIGPVLWEPPAGPPVKSRRIKHDIEAVIPGDYPWRGQKRKRAPVRKRTKG